MYNQPFVIITTSCCNLNQVFKKQNKISTNITFYSLNLKFFQNPQWANLPKKKYRPKFSETTDTYLFITKNGTKTPTIKGYKGLTPLFNTKKLTKSKKLPKYTAEVFNQNKTVKQTY